MHKYHPSQDPFYILVDDLVLQCHYEQDLSNDIFNNLVSAIVYFGKYILRYSSL